MTLTRTRGRVGSLSNHKGCRARKQNQATRYTVLYVKTVEEERGAEYQTRADWIMKGGGGGL